MTVRPANTPISLGIRRVWPESSLGEHAILLVLSWSGSYVQDIFCKECLRLAGVIQYNNWNVTILSENLPWMELLITQYWRRHHKHIQHIFCQISASFPQSNTDKHHKTLFGWQFTLDRGYPIQQWGCYMEWKPVMDGTINHSINMSKYKPRYHQYMSCLITKPTKWLVCLPSEHSDHSGHPPSLIRVFAVRSLGIWNY